MSLGKTEQSFSAILKTLDDKVLEYGAALACADSDWIEFKSEFVPIFKMGTSLKVVRTQGELETQIFTGEVYLSSPNLLRLVSVRDEVLPGAASAFLYDVSLSGQATALVAEEKPKRFSLLHKHPKPTSHTFPVAISAISLSQVKLTCDLPLAKDQQLTLDVCQPFRLDKLPLQVEMMVSFGEESETKCYRCRILELTGNNYLQLHPFVERLSQQTNKQFPPLKSPSESV